MKTWGSVAMALSVIPWAISSILCVAKMGWTVDEKKVRLKAQESSTGGDAPGQDGGSALKRKDVDDGSEDDWDDLACEERLAKKVKQGKLSSNAFDKEILKYSLSLHVAFTCTYTVISCNAMAMALKVIQNKTLYSFELLV